MAQPPIGYLWHSHRFAACGTATDSLPVAQPPIRCLWHSHRFAACGTVTDSLPVAQSLIHYLWQSTSYAHVQALYSSLSLRARCPERMDWSFRAFSIYHPIFFNHPTTIQFLKITPPATIHSLASPLLNYFPSRDI